MELINNPTQSEIKKAAKALKDGHLVAFPTETVYGLGADATNEKAVNRIYTVKGRPIGHPLIVHISSINQLGYWAIDIPDYAIQLANDFWPGPVTLILKKSDLAKNFITGGQASVGLRIPAQSIALSLINEFQKLGGLGIAAPSANKFTAVSTTTALAVKQDIGSQMISGDLILDGGQSMIGLESTIIDCTVSNPRILRKGLINIDQISKSIGFICAYQNDTTVKVSGNFKKHYSPKAKIILNKKPAKGQGLIALSHFKTPENVIRLAAPVTEDEFAYILYESLRLADAMSLSEIVIYLPEGEGVAVAIRDRLIKASNDDESIGAQ
jgi:L-threonylcarbamoyladenylate synthase